MSPLARVLPFLLRRKPKEPTKPPPSFLDAPSGLRIDVTVRKPTEPDKG